MPIGVKVALEDAAAQDGSHQDEEQPLVIAGVYIGTKAEQEARARAQIRLLDELAAGDPSYNEQTLAELKKGLNESRRAVGARLLFPEDEP